MWKSLTKKFEFNQNLHEFERIRAIWENVTVGRELFQFDKNLFEKFSALIKKHDEENHISGLSILRSFDHKINADRS